MKYIKRVYTFFRDIAKTNVSVYSANASFYIMISAFPMLMLLLALLQFTPITRGQLMTGIGLFIPEFLMPLISDIVSDLFSKASGALISVTALAAAWSASRGTLSLINGLNLVFQVEESRGYFLRRVVALIYMLALIVGLVLMLVLHVFGNSINGLMSKYFPNLIYVINLILSFRSLIAIVALTLIFMSVYKVFPNRRASFKSQLPGAALAALGWMLFSFFFSIYIDNFGNFSLFYGSLATIVLGMLWLNVCMTILFMGGSLNHWLELRTEP